MKSKLIVAVVAVSLLIVPLFSLVATGTVRAADFRSGDNVFIGEDENINSSLFIAGDRVEVAATVDGDIFCAGSVVTISGNVRGDVICAAQEIIINANVEGDVRLVAQTTTIRGLVGGNATVAAEDLLVERGAVIRDLATYATNLDIRGQIDRDLDVGAETVRIDGAVGRNINAEITQLNIASGAQVDGDVTYKSDNRIEQGDGAVISGEVNRRPLETSQSFGASQVAATVFFFVMIMLVVSMALAALFPRVMQRISTNGVDRLGMTALTGAAAVFLLPIVLLLLTISIFGSLLGIIGFLAYMLMLSLSGPVFGYYIGRQLIGGKSRNPLLYMFVGSLILLVLYIIPVIGIVALLTAAVLGSGMIVQEVLRRAARPVYDTAEIDGKPPVKDQADKKKIK